MQRKAGRRVPREREGCGGSGFCGMRAAGKGWPGAVRAPVLKGAARARPAISSVPGVLAALPSQPTTRARGAQRMPRLRTWDPGFARCGSASFAGFLLLREGGRFQFWCPREVLLLSFRSLRPAGSGRGPGPAR